MPSRPALWQHSFHFFFLKAAQHSALFKAPRTKSPSPVFKPVPGPYSPHPLSSPARLVRFGRQKAKRVDGGTAGTRFTSPRAPGGLRPSPAPPLRLPTFSPSRSSRGGCGRVRGGGGPGGGARPPLPWGGRPPRSLHWPERAAGASADVRRARVRRAQRRQPSSPGSGGGAPSGGGGQHAARLRLGLPHPRRPRPRQQRRRRRSSERRPGLQRRRVRARGAAAGIGAGAGTGDPAWRCGGAAAGRPGCSCCCC